MSASASASASAAPGQARSSRSCAAPHSRTILRNGAVRVYRVRAFIPDAQVDGGLIYACRRATGGRVRIGERYTDNYVLWGTLQNLRLVGSTVASVQSQTDASCKADCPPGYNVTVTWVQVNDIASGKHRVADLQGSLLSKRLLVNSSGVVAWVDGAAGAARLNTLSTSGSRAVDQGNIDAASVTLAGSTLSWSKDGQAHSVPADR